MLTRRGYANAVLHSRGALRVGSAVRFQSGFGKQSTPANFGLVIVPQQKSYVVERFGKYRATLTPGLHLLIPLVDQVSYVHSLKEDAIPIASQTAVTRDNVILSIDGVLYMRIVDPVKASYGVSDPHYALTQLAQTTMRSELGKLTLDKIFQERDHLNVQIVAQINEAAANWGAEVLRYEIKDIIPPSGVRSAMEMQAEAERRKRAQVLESEGYRDAQINNAEGSRKSAVLEAEGEAEATLLRARATARAISVVGSSVGAAGGRDAVSMRIAEQYIEAFGRLAKAGNTLVLPANAGDAAGMVAQALAVFSTVRAGNVGSGVAGADATQEQHNDDHGAAAEVTGSASDSALPGHAGHDSESPAAEFTPSDFSAVKAPLSDAGQSSSGGGSTSGFTPKPF